MKNGLQKPTFRIAFCGVSAALGVVLMMITSLIPVGTYALPCFAGIILLAVLIEYGAKWAAGVFLTVSALSGFLAGDKEAVLFYIVFFGYYPIVKCKIESRIKSKIVQYILKFSVFNIAAVASFYIGMWLLSIPKEDYTIFGVCVPWVFLIVGNIFFALYDYAVTVFVNVYVRNLRNKLFGKIK